MKKSAFLLPKILLIFIAILLVAACSKQSNYINGDAKVRFFHAAVSDTSQFFYLNGIKQGVSAQYNTNTSYIVVPGDSSILNTISARDINRLADSASLDKLKFLVGKNYSAYFTKTKAGDPGTLKFYEDDVKIDIDSTKLTFLNVGYTLGSDVIVSDVAKAFPDFTVKYGEMLNRKIKVSKETVISFALKNIVSNPPPKVDTLKLTGASPIMNGKTYTIVIDGTKLGDLHTRLVNSN